MEYRRRIRTMNSNPELKGISMLLNDIPFLTYDGQTLSLKMIIPYRNQANAHKRYPLVVFIQGSAWTTPDQNFEIPQLGELSRRGYVVASVTHRSCFDAPAPAFLQDVKAAIRFLRAHAEEYSIDPTRVCAWGTSSGGNTALLLGLTHGLSDFDTPEYLGFSSEVQAVVDCFGPTDLVSIVGQFEHAPDEMKELLNHLAGGAAPERLDVLQKISPIAYVHKDGTYPPFLLLHGDADELVPYEQTEKFYHKLCECGHDATMYRVIGAPHEDSFWSTELLNVIFDFIDEKLS